MSCFPSEDMTFEISTDPIPAGNDPAPIIVAADAATYNPISGLSASFVITPTVNRDDVPLLDFPGARANCVVSCVYAFSASGVICPGDAGYDDLRDIGDQCIEAFFRYRELGTGSGIREIIGVGVPIITVTHTPNEQIKYTLEIDLRIVDIRVQP